MEGSAFNVPVNTTTRTAGESAALGGWWLVLLPCFPPSCGAIVESCAAVRGGVLQSVWLVFKKEKKNEDRIWFIIINVISLPVVRVSCKQKKENTEAKDCRGLP